MYLSIGNDMAVRDSSIIGIFDMDNATLSAVTRKFLSVQERAGLSQNAADEEIPKSFLLYLDVDGSYKICFSQLSSASLKGRINNEL